MNEQMPMVANDAATYAAAVAGATAASLANRSADSWKRKASEWGIMALVGVFIGPSVWMAAGLTNPHAQSAAVFGVAVCGATILTGMMDAVKGLNLGDLVAKWLGREARKFQ